ncbi:MAG: hypothetical protein U9R58_06345, partial [Chloroflexota bacterium]|nr:hypothetical protein [Chloroflexota bacterium]
MGNLREQQSGSSKDNMLRSIIIFLVVTTSFAIAYTQSPLFTSNQNQYFLHGLADAGFGNLSQDWLVNTLDPTPVFSQLVSLTDQFFGPHFIFYFYYALLMGVYLFSLVGIVLNVYELRRTPAAFSVFLALLILVHSAGLRFLLSRTLGVNWAYILEDGLADQRILGPVFQPSTFGVLLILSIYLCLHKHPFLAVLSAVIAATVHPTYLLSAALLTLSFMVAAYFEERKVIKPLLIGGLALLTVSPILYYVLSNFANTHPESTALAREILVNFRIPHHAQIDWWFDATAVIKILFVVAAIYLVRKLKPLFIILMTLTTAAAGLTIAQLILDSDALALIFPWRVSTILVPVSVSIIIGYLVLYISQRFKEQFAKQTNL